MQKKFIAIVFVLLALTVSNSSAISYSEIQNSTTKKATSNSSTPTYAEIQNSITITDYPPKEATSDSNTPTYAEIQNSITITDYPEKKTEHNFNIRPKKVADGVWCIFGALDRPTKANAGFMSNSCYIQTNNSWVLWDAGASYKFAKQAYAAMSKIAQLPVSTVIISHEHDDHWLGAGYYKERFGAKIIGPVLINKKYHKGDKTRMFKTLDPNDIAGTEIVKMDETYPKGKKLEIGGVKMEYIPLGQAHSEEDYCLYMPEKKVMLAADAVMNGRITSNRDGSVIGSLKALKKIKSEDWSILVPGHGYITDETAADESTLYFTLLKERVLKAIDDGVEADDITKTVTLPEFKDKKMYKLLNYLNVYGAYTELEMYDEDEDEEATVEEEAVEAPTQEIVNTKKEVASTPKQQTVRKVTPVTQSVTPVTPVKKVNDTLTPVKKVSNNAVQAVQAIEKVATVKEVDEKAIAAVKAIQEVAKAMKAKINAKDNSSEFNYNLKPKQVSSNVWCFFGALERPTKANGGNMSNSCYIKTDDSWVLWDSGPSYVFAKQAYAAMSKIAKLPVKYVILSHEHDDHWLGNNYYKDAFSAEIIGPKSVNENYHDGVKTRMFKTLSKNAIKGTKIIKVDASYDNAISFNVSGVDFEYIPVGQAHSVEDYFLYMPKNRLLLAGDLVMNGRITSNRDGSVIGQLKALKMINSKEWKTLIPGHGYIIDKHATDESVKYFTLLKDRVLKAIDDGVDADDITKTVTLPEFKDKKMYKLLNYLNVYGAYTELEMYDEE